MDDHTIHEKGPVRLELLYFDGCPHWELADQRLRAVAQQRGLEIEHRLVTSAQEADAVGFRGSPTVFVDGRDPFAAGDDPCGLSCRVYRTPDGLSGSPTVEQLEAALDR